MSKQSEKVKRWRRNFKARIIASMGGGCCICGYNKCQSALALHHLDPSQKEMSLGSIRANPKNWNSIVEELRKCILVCHVCHSEIHEGITPVPANAPKFDESFSNYKEIERNQKLTPCPVCNTLKRDYLINCSVLCARRARRRIDWDSVDLQKELQTKSIVALAEEMNCSDGAIHKRLKRLGLK